MVKKKNEACTGKRSAVKERGITSLLIDERTSVAAKKQHRIKHIFGILLRRGVSKPQLPEN